MHDSTKDVISKAARKFGGVKAENRADPILACFPRSM